MERSYLQNRVGYVMLAIWETRELKAAYPPSSEGLPSGRKKGGMPMYVTYSDLIQIGIFIVALAGLLYQIFRGKK
ncbi:MAG: hypothetical protein NC541_11630 [bacterium]|nr:hypothetical protein [bacterium]